ncbi:MAG TPA: hypothetical protein VFK03_03950, partial [Candidatus Saccharimonadales bacterium]|nr:hypothetical protein [Candidatus Saccharimonadales bacterium]
MSREQQPPSIETDRRALTKKLSVRLGLCAVGGFLGAVPLASTYSLSHTSVEDDFGPFPANISLAPGHSSLEVALGKKLYNQDLTNHGFGVNIQPDGLPDIDLNDLKDKDFHRLAEQTVGLYKEPRTVAEGYNQALSQELIDQLEKSELIVGGSLTAAGFLIISLLSRELKDDRRRKPTVIVMSGLAIVAAGASISIYHDWQANNQLPENTYAV